MLQPLFSTVEHALKYSQANRYLELSEQRGLSFKASSYTKESGKQRRSDEPNYSQNQEVKKAAPIVINNPLKPSVGN